MTPESPVLQARATATRVRLLAAARASFAARGHDGVNLKTDILGPAGVSVGSFYHQFGDKTDLLAAVLDETADEWRAAVLSPDVMVDGDALEGAVSAGMSRFYAGLDLHEDLWRIHLRERGNPDPRVRERVLAGREAWRRDLASQLANARRASGLSAPAGYVNRAADLLIALSAGLATTYLDLPETKRTARARRVLVVDATAFAIGGIRHATSGSHC